MKFNENTAGDFANMNGEMAHGPDHLHEGTLLSLDRSHRGAVGWHYYQHRRPGASATQGANSGGGRAVGSGEEKTCDVGADARHAIAARTSDWNLDPASIKRELTETGGVIRSKAKVAGKRIDDARVRPVIKGKYSVEKDLRVRTIKLDCRDGEANLRGTVPSEALIGRAVTLALETKGGRRWNRD